MMNENTCGHLADYHDQAGCLLCGCDPDDVEDQYEVLYGENGEEG